MVLSIPTLRCEHSKLFCISSRLLSYASTIYRPPPINTQYKRVVYFRARTHSSVMSYRLCLVRRVSRSFFFFKVCIKLLIKQSDFVYLCEFGVCFFLHIHRYRYNNVLQCENVTVRQVKMYLRLFSVLGTVTFGTLYGCLVSELIQMEITFSCVWQ